MTLTRHLKLGVAWGSASVATNAAFQILFMSVMARLLDPEDFGIVAIANVALKFLSYFSQLGVGPALIQRNSISDGHIQAALSISVVVSVGFLVLSILVASRVEQFFAVPGLASVLSVLAVSFIITGFGSVSAALLRRNKRFKRIALIDTLSYVLGYGLVGVVAAYLGAGAWSLVAAFLSQALLATALNYAAVRHALSLRSSSQDRRDIIGFGAQYSVIGFIEFVTSSLDSLVVGKYLGATSAGLYNRAQLLAYLPAQQPIRVVTQALFPILSSISDKKNKQAESLRLGVLVTGVYAFSVSAGLWVAAHDVVGVLLGEKWSESGDILRTLALSVGPIYVANVMGVTLDSMAELRKKLTIQLVTLMSLIAMLVAITPISDARSIAMVVAATFWVRFVLMGVTTVRFLRIDCKTIGRILVPILVAASSTLLSVTVATNLLADAVALIRLIAQIAAGGFGLLLGVIFTKSVWRQDEAALAMVSQIPGFSRLFRF